MDGSAGAETSRLSDSAHPESPVAGMLLAGRYRVLPDRRLEALDSPQAKAYAAFDGANPDVDLFCLVSPLEALPRLRTAETMLVAQPVEGLLTPLAACHCSWPGLSRPAAAFIFRRPGGERLASGCASGLSAAEIARSIVAPLTQALSEIGAQGLTHRAVRADNLFWSDAGKTAVVLGECVTADAGSDQPALYEPLTRMAAMTCGRGRGTAGDDFYALGVTLIDLIYGFQTVDGRSSGPFLRKLEKGSLAGLMPHGSPAPELAALLRGLLSDNPEARWSTRHLSRWLAGEPIDTPHPLRLDASLRPLVIGSNRVRTARSLAHALGSDRENAGSLLRDGTVERWLRSSLRDTRLAVAIAREVREWTAKPVARSRAAEVLITRCCRVLDPDGPLRFGSLAVMPGSYGLVLASLMLRESDTTEFQELLRALAAGELEPLQAPDGEGQPEPVDLVAVLDRPGPGGGITRCLYDLAPDLPCLSPLLEGAVDDPRVLLEALDRRSRDMPEGSALMDGHVAAFIASKLGLVPEPAWREGGDAFGIRDQLRLLALVQARRGPARLPSLARTAAVRLSPMIRSVRSKSLRKRLAAAVAECVERGDLLGIMERLDDPVLWQRDRAGLERAQREFAMYRRELECLADPRRSGMAEAPNEGRRLAVVVSMSVALAILSLLLLA